MTPLIVFSHLRWDFVYQRPQHLLSRLGRHRRVLYVEEPVHTDGPARLDRRTVAGQVEVLVPHTPVRAPGFHDDQLGVLQTLLHEAVQAERLADHAAWLYTPMALPLAASLAPQVMVYDCMDELANFDHAPRQLQQRESALFGAADLVFTGGPALFEAKRHRHRNIHCLPSSVDSGHYAPSRLDRGSAAAAEVERLQGDLPRPRLGFFGVIDERLDVALLGRLARAHPEWQLVMVGPVVKIDPATLPREPNILWAGMQPYERLPYFVAGWDACLMPFAINRATQFISPTKTLEYFAGERPVVSTPVPDVVGLHGDTVDIGSGDEFIQACEASLARTGAARANRLEAMRRTVAQSSWDLSALKVQALLADALAGAERDDTVTPVRRPVPRANVVSGGVLGA